MLPAPCMPQASALRAQHFFSFFVVFRDCDFLHYPGAQIHAEGLAWMVRCVVFELASACSKMLGKVRVVLDIDL